MRGCVSIGIGAGGREGDEAFGGTNARGGTSFSRVSVTGGATMRGCVSIGIGAGGLEGDEAFGVIGTDARGTVSEGGGALINDGFGGTDARGIVASGGGPLINAGLGTPGWVESGIAGCGCVSAGPATAANASLGGVPGCVPEGIRTGSSPGTVSLVPTEKCWPVGTSSMPGAGPGSTSGTGGPGRFAVFERNACTCVFVKS